MQVTNIELAYAYNQGAHIGVTRSIAAGYMSRCEMVWTTAGVLRTCSRCLELKDKVIGYTDEQVQLPPLHPRCRCCVIYRETNDAAKVPQIVITNYEDAAKVRPPKEFLTFANRMKPTIELYTGCKSKWSGQIIFDDKESNSKLWDCSIRLNPDAPLHALIHELIHSCSASRFGAQVYIRHRWEEELTVHYLSQELALREKIPIVDSGYDEGVELIRKFKAALGMSTTDLEFASALIKEDLGYRFDWLAAQIVTALGSEATIEQYNDFLTKLEAIRQWTPT